MKIRSLPTKHRPTGWAPLKDAFLQPNLLVELSLYFPSSLPPSKAHAWRAPPLDDTYTLYSYPPTGRKARVREISVYNMHHQLMASPALPRAHLVTSILTLFFFALVNRLCLTCSTNYLGLSFCDW